MEPGGKGQLPGGQTAKARPGHRVQSLHKGHGRHVFPRIRKRACTMLSTSVCTVVYRNLSSVVLTS
jgi:hypothetical protein